MATSPEQWGYLVLKYNDDDGAVLWVLRKAFAGTSLCMQSRRQCLAGACMLTSHPPLRLCMHSTL